MMIRNSIQICRKGSNKGGALGGFFTFGGKDIYGISNNHVLANFNNCKVGDTICRAGSDLVVGLLDYWIKLNREKNFLDIALFKLSPSIRPYWDLQGKASYPGNIRKGLEGEKVYMIRNSGQIKEGRITRLVVDNEIIFTLLGRQYPFRSLTEIEPLYSQPFSVEGESGSLIFSEDNDVLGILMGTLYNGSKSYYVPFVNGAVGINAVYNLQVWQP